MIVSVTYRSPCQNNDGFDAFLSNFEQLLRDINELKPSLSVITGDFNARSSSGGLMIPIPQRDQNCFH